MREMFEMGTKCNVCEDTLENPVYTSEKDLSITTMGTLLDGETRVYFCGNCAHIQTTELSNIDEYYALEYEINAESKAADQLYEICGDTPIFRADKQAEVFLQKVAPKEGSLILDYGCAKGATLRSICEVNQAITPYMFDVTDRYVDFWKEFVAEDNYACFEVNPEWRGMFDVITSFYALEHIADLDTCLNRIHDLLAEDGKIHFMVPNCFENIADFVVADHVNHFSKFSIAYLLHKYDFTDIVIDDSIYDSALVVNANKSKHSGPTKGPRRSCLDDVADQVAKLADYWRGIRERLESFDQQFIGDRSISIYGAGFYGSFIRSCLRSDVHIHSILDMNPHLHGQLLDQTPVVRPDQMPANVDVLLVGLNPAKAGHIIEQAGIPDVENKHVFYL
ncbi:MAG: class I SAM-dependent methyltransferase [bacterium]